MTFDGFISYSHAADGRLAPAVQRGLHRLAKPWHRRRALWIFRDQTGLAVTPGLWSSIQTALDGSEYFVLMASPEAARSPWVNREIEHWIATKSTDRILPVVTDGEWAWDTEKADFADGSTAVPAALRGVFTEEPFFLDLRWARGSEHLSLHHSRFRDAIAQLAAPMHGLSKDELEGEDVRQHRRAKRLRSGAVATLVVLALVASLTGMSAVRNAERAKNSAAEALRQQQVANQQRDSAERSAQEARQQQELARRQQDRATRAAAEAEQAERAARTQQKVADEAAADAKRQRQLADQATVRKQEQEQRAREASDRAKRAQREADRLAAVAAEKQRLAREAAAAAEKQQRIAVSRRLMNQAGTVLVNDPQTALMLGTAAQELNPDTATTRQLSGFVTATSYAGSLPDVTAAQYLPDGVVLTRSRAGNVSLWKVTDPHNPVRLATLTEKAGGGIDMQTSSDGRTLAFVNTEREAVLWDIATRTRPARIAQLETGGDLNTIAFSGDGTTYVTGDARGKQTIWDTTDRMHPALLHSMTTFNPYPVVGLTLSPDARLLIVDQGRFYPTYDLADRSDPKSINMVTEFPDAPAAFSPDGATLVFGTYNGSIAGYDWMTRMPGYPGAARVSALAGDDDDDTPQPPPPLPTDDYDPYPDSSFAAFGSRVNGVAFSRDGKLLAAGDNNGVVKVWEWATADTYTASATLQAHGSIGSVSFDPAGSMLVTTDSSATATLWNVTAPGAPDPLAHVTAPDGTAQVTLFGPDGRSLLAAGSAGKAGTWNVTDPRRPARGADLTLSNGDVRALAFSPDQRTVAVAAASGTLTIADPVQPARTTALAVPPGEVSTIGAMVFSPDGRTLAVVAGSGTLMLWDVGNRAHPTQLARLTGAFGGVLAFSPDGRTLASGADDYAVTLWNVANRAAPARLTTMAGHSGYISALAFSPDGRYLVSGSADRTTILWDVTNPAAPLRITTQTGHNGSIYAIAFSPDGRTLATADASGVVLLWDTTGPDGAVRIGTLRTPGGDEARNVAFRRDGGTVAVTGQPYRKPAVVTLWNLGTLNGLRTNPARYACAITGRGLSTAEWNRFIPEIKYRKTCPK